MNRLTSGRTTIQFKLIAASLTMMIALPTFSQESITPEKITDSIYMLSGKGGNIGIFMGQDGTFMIDDKFAPMSEDIQAAIESIGGQSPEYLLNTHFHGDHTGGNEYFGKAGATIISHHNVRQRLSDGYSIAVFDNNTPPAVPEALQTITYSADMILHTNNETVRIVHAPNSHTDGDSFVHFESANVIHTGDLFFNGFYPFIDVQNGGKVQGMIDSANTILELTDASTIIIPGHGPIANADDLRSFRDMLTVTQERLGELKSDGLSAAEAVAKNPLSDMEEEWADGFLDTGKWITIIYDSI